jgi:hypothetical protein
MWRTPRALTVTLLLGVAFTMAEMQKIEFTPAAGAPPADAIRLTRGKDGVFLFASKTASTPPMGARTTISAVAPGASRARWKTVATLDEMVPAQPIWDVTLAEGSQPDIVYERPGGAINALLLRRASGATEGLSGAYPLQSFSDPRFARPTGKPPQWMTAVVDNRTCVALPLRPGAEYRTLGECSGAGLLVLMDSGFVYLYKTKVPGLVRGNLNSPGRLHLATLDAELRPTGPPTEVFSGTIFEFDADVIRNKLVVLATTPSGIAILSGNAGPSGKMEIKEFPVPLALLNPAIAAGESGKAFLAALDGTRVLRAEADIP